MMNTQSNRLPAEAAPASLRALRRGSVLALGSAGGRLDVVRGAVWLTRSGDPDDHLVGVGQSVSVPPSGRVLIEAWRDEPALVAWQPSGVRGRLRAAFGRCWDIVDPGRRVGAGVAAALVAAFAGAALFGPVSAARTQALLGAALLHNGAGARVGIDLDAGPPTGPSHDVGAGPRERARVAAQEARRGKACAA